MAKKRDGKLKIGSGDAPASANQTDQGSTPATSFGADSSSLPAATAAGGAPATAGRIRPNSPRLPWLALVVVLAAAVLAGFAIADSFGHQPRTHYGPPTVTSAGVPAGARVVTTATTITAP